MKEKIRGIRLNFAVVLNADVDTIESIQGFLEELSDCRVIYQRTNAGKLYITEDDDDD